MFMKIKLLGIPQVLYEGSWQDIAINKAYLLTIYLVYKTDWVSRDEILGLFYPELPEEKARVNLRALLKRVRKMPLCETLESKDSRLRLQASSDVKAFQEAINEQNWQTAIELYNGDFLKGFNEKSPSLEAWLALERRSLQEAYYYAILECANALEKAQNFTEALALLNDALKEESLNEELVQAYMRCAHLAGRRKKALEIFESFKAELEDELAISPLAETLILAEKIKQSLDFAYNSEEHSFSNSTAAFIAELEAPSKPFHNFVARQGALGWLEDHWLKVKVRGGHGQIALIHGEAGTGKSTLIKAFCKSMQKNTLVAKGQCSSYMGVGDPYLVFQDIFTNILKALESNGELLQQLLKAGSGLLGTLVPKVLEQTLSKLKAKERQACEAILKTGITITHQSQLFTETTAVLEQLAKKVPLVMVLDDLQWADASSLSLLFYLSQHLRGLPVLFIIAYRTSEATESAGLVKLSNEFKRLYGEVTLDLDKVVEEEQEIFVNALLDSEQNQFSEQFRKDIVDKTGGHPLFLLELLESLETKGQLTNQEGKWLMTSELSSVDLPAKVEAVIAERMRYVSSELREILSAASVEGESFTVELIADLLNQKVWDIVKAFGTLDKQHQLIKLQGFKEVAGKRLSRYSFRHQLFQDYLYNQLNEAEKSFLHGEVGNALVKLAPKGPSEFSLQLAQHFQLARQMDKALLYWQDAAGHAERLAAYSEAVGHIEEVLKLLVALPSEQSLPLELSLQLRLGEMYLKIKGWAAPEVEKAFLRAHNLCRFLEQSAELAPALLGLCTYYQNRADYKTAAKVGDKLIQTLKQNPQAPVLAFPAQGWNYLFQGNLMKAKEFFEEGNRLYNRKELHPEGIGSLSGLAWTLAMMGLENEAFEYLGEALSLSENIKEPFNCTVVHTYASFINAFTSKWEVACKHSQTATTLAQKYCFPVVGAAAQYFGGYALYWLGSKQEGTEHMLQGFKLWQTCGSRLAETGYLVALAEVYIDLNNVSEAQKVLKQSQEKMNFSAEFYYQPELYRLQGKLLSLAGHVKEASDTFDRGILIAKEQCSKVLEARLLKDCESLTVVSQQKSR